MTHQIGSKGICILFPKMETIRPDISIYITKLISEDDFRRSKIGP